MNQSMYLYTHACTYARHHSFMKHTCMHASIFGSLFVCPCSFACMHNATYTMYAQYIYTPATTTLCSGMLAAIQHTCTQRKADISLLAWACLNKHPLSSMRNPIFVVEEKTTRYFPLFLIQVRVEIKPTSENRIPHCRAPPIIGDDSFTRVP